MPASQHRSRSSRRTRPSRQGRKRSRPARRTQAERSAATRALLLDATIDCLVEHGYAGTSTVAVCRRAAVSHGSLLHHFGTRERLLGGALDLLYARLRDPVVAAIEALPRGEARVDALVEAMWSAFGAREFKAVIELWLAATNQPDVGWAVWPGAQAFDDAIQPLAERILPEVAARVPDFPVYVSLLFQALQGMGLTRATFPGRDAAHPMRTRVRALLARIVRDAFAGAEEP